jgi:hypothetical protein
MKYLKSKHPKYIKYSYRNKEFIWVKVDEYDDNKNIYYGTIDNTPISKSIKKGDRVKVHKNKIVDIIK